MNEPKYRRVRIEHDGGINPVLMRVVDAETGELLRWVKRVELIADAQSGELTATIFVHAPELNVTVDAQIRELPND